MHRNLKRIEKETVAVKNLILLRTKLTNIIVFRVSKIQLHNINPQDICQRKMNQPLFPVPNLQLEEIIVRVNQISSLRETCQRDR